MTWLRRHWVPLLGLLGVAALVAVVNPAEVARTLAGVDVRPLLLMLPAVLLLYVLHGLAWAVALRGVGARMSLARAVQVTYISQAFDVVPGGDLWRVPIVSSRAGARAESGRIAAAVVFDDLIYFLVLTAAIVPAAVSLPFLRPPLAAVLVPQLAIFTVLLWPALFRAVAEPVGRWRWLRRWAPQLTLLGPSFRHLFWPRTLVPVLVLDAGCAALAVGLYWLALAAVHTTGIGPAQATFTYAGSQVLGGLTVLPAVMGAYEALMTALLAFQGVPPAAAAAAVLLYRAVNDVLMALLGLGVAVWTEPTARVTGWLPAGPETQPSSTAEKSPAPPPA